MDLVEISNQFMSLGITGVVCFVLGKTFLEEKKADKEYYQNSLKECQDLYREELMEDRRIYLESINVITNSLNAINNKVTNLEEDIKDIKDTLNK